MGEEVAQRHKDIALLLATGGDHRLQAGIYRGPVVGAKTAAHFLLDLGRPQVSFGLVVGERHPLHQRKGQNGILMLHQTAKQLTPRRAFGASPARFGLERGFCQFHLETGNIGFQKGQSLVQDFCFRQLIDHGDGLAPFP